MWNRSISWLSEETDISRLCTQIHTYTYIRTRSMCMCVCVYIVNIYIYTHTHMHMYNIYIYATDIPRTFSRPVSSFVTLPSLFSDFLSSASAIHFFLARNICQEAWRKRKTERKAKAFRVYLTPQMWYTANYPRAREKDILSRARYSAVKRKVSSVIHTKYIL